MLTPKIREEILDRLEIIRNAPQSAFEQMNSLNAYLEVEALNHSFLIEYPEFVPRFWNISQKAYRAERKKKRRKVQQLEHAWNYLINQEKELTPESLITVNRIIKPNTLDDGYRDVTITVEGYERAPFERDGPIKQQLEEQMNDFFNDLQNAPQLYSFLDRAIYAHFQLLRIHPFSDGNGRTARIVQNSILHRHGLPPAIIYEGERRFYFDLLMDAYKGFEIGNQKPIELFGGYIASKVNISLDRIMSGNKDSC